MATVFISYRSLDRVFAMRLAQSLKDAGHDVWIDQWRITGRDPYWYEIQNGIQQCTHFIFVISPDSISRAGNNGALKELFHAVGLQQPPILIPVVGKETPYNQLPMVITPGMYQIHNFVLRPYDEALQSVLTALESKTITQSAAAVRQSTQPSAMLWQGRPGTKWLVIAIPVILVVIIAAGLLLTGAPKPAGSLTETPASSQPVIVAASSEMPAAQPSAIPATQVEPTQAATSILPSPTPVPPSLTPIPPSLTPIPPSLTPVPPSLTPIPPSLTPIPPTVVIDFQATADTRATQQWSQVLGHYEVAGTYANGSAYSGTLDVVPNGAAYSFNYVVQNAATSAIGVKIDDFLAVAYGARCGVLLYKIQSDQSLVGLFAYGSVSGSEIDRPSGNLAGNYQTTVKINGQAAPQDYTMTVANQNGGHYFKWSNGSEGFSVQNGSMIAIVYGTATNALDGCGVLLFRIQSDGSLLGQYNYRNRDMGTENDYR